MAPQPVAAPEPSASSALPSRAPRSRFATLRIIAITLVALMLIGRLVLRPFVFEAYRISNAGLFPTLLADEHVFANKAAYGPRLPFEAGRLWNGLPPKRGDLVVFEYPEAISEHFIQRVVALPGEKIEVRRGRVWINDAIVPRCRVGRTSYEDPAEGPRPASKVEGDVFVELLEGRPHLTFADTRDSPMSAGPWTVKAGEVFVLGDNRNRSRDSRFWWNGKGGGVPFERIRGRVGTIWESSDHERVFTNAMEPPTLPTSMKANQAQLDACLGSTPKIEPEP